MRDLYLDHVLIAVRDLGLAAQTFSHNLGFTLTPEGVHPGRGTYNRLIVFGPDYLELIAIRDTEEGVFRPTMTTFLESREGLYMFALGTTDIDRAVADLRNRAVSVEDPAEGARQGSGSAPGYTWRFAGVPPDVTPGSETFIIQHNNTIEERYTEPPNATQHANGALGVHHLAIAVMDADESAHRWQQAFGLGASPLKDMPEQGIRRARLRLRRCYLDFVSPLRSGALSRYLERNGEAPYSLALRVQDLAQTAAILNQRGVPTRTNARGDDGASVTVDPAYAHGVTLRFIQAAG